MACILISSVSVIFLSVLVLTLSPTTNCLSLDDRLHLKHLTEYDYVDNKIKEGFSTYVARLDALMENYVNNMKEVLEAKDARLEELESKVTRLEEIIAWKNEKQISSAEFTPNNLVVNRRSFMEKSIVFPRTCREVRAADPSLKSGMNWIDPDGQGVGDDPIFVYCDMIKGSTSILHDSESSMDVGHCPDPGCYSRPINYNATMRQMIALSELSSECHQTIKYDCNFAPFEIGGVTFNWWNDRNGTARNFWSGDNSTVHTCQCGIDHNCVESSLTCNCDSAAPVPLTDSGVITDKTFLPITRLNFGRTQLASSSGIYTLGRLECSGQVDVNGMPKSCVDLWKIGHSLNGLYSVIGTQRVESVYCDFTKLYTDPSLQSWIGYVDVKSSPVYFYVQKNSTFSAANMPIPFELERLNIGNAMDLKSGKFTTPQTGTYFFSFSGMVQIAASSTNRLIRLGMYLNGNLIGSGHADEVGTDLQDETLSLQSTMNLKVGDQIWLEIFYMHSGTYLYDSGSHYTHFTGWLLEEHMSVNIK